MVLNRQVPVGVQIYVAGNIVETTAMYVMSNSIAKHWMRL
jgi:hypothetical protein